MVRTIIIPTNSDIRLKIAKKYIGKPIEITYLALDELETKQDPKSMADFWGVISDETAQTLHKTVNQLRTEWERNI